MYQVPVLGLDKIRRSRKNVKTILSEFGLEQCELLSQEVEECDPGEAVFNDTEWSDLTVGFHGKRRKKWRYRTQALCCSLCKYSARSWNTFHGHIKCYHPHEKNVAFLSACSACSFIGHPRVLKRHFLYFHSDLPKPQPVESGSPSVRPAAVEKYICRKCSYEDPLLYCIKKHVLFRHCLSLWYQHAGQKTESEQKAERHAFKYYCKSCGTSAETIEHLVYHVLTSEKHKDLDAHIHGLIWQKLKQKKPYPALAPKAQLLAPKSVSSNLTILKPVQTSLPITASSSNQLPVTGGSPSGVVLQGLSSSSNPMVSGQGTTQLLPAQAAALVQLASAEAKGLLRSDIPVTHTSAHHAKVVSDPALPAISTCPSTPLQPVMPNKTVGGQILTKQQQIPQHFAVPPRASLNIHGQMPSGLAPQPGVMTPNPATPRATMLTSQSLLSHLIPTGNNVNGLPTYTLAPLQVNLPVQSGKGSVVGKVPGSLSQNSISQTNRAPSRTSVESGKTKKWTTCSFCKELFPSDVYHVHMEVHKLKSKTGLAARAPFLKKMPDKTVKCLLCKVLLSEKGLFEHMRHGMSCLYCPGLFYSIKHLIEHIGSEHSPLQKENCDFMRREYRLYSDECGNILFPYFDINTTAPKEILGEQEVNLALVTSSLDLIFVKMSPTAAKPVCQSSTKTNLKECPFCSEELMSTEDTRIHLRERHFITPTIHAILKTPAYKCVYCGGVYTGKTTTKAIAVHLQRCKCAPKIPIDAERIRNTRRIVTPSNGINLPLKPLQPQQVSTSMTTKPKEPESEVEIQRKMRLEMAVKEAMEANKREREARAARKKLEREKQTSPVAPELDSSVPLTLDTTGMWKRSFEDRREFLTKYFHTKPYLTRSETTALASQLLLNKSDVACHFGTKRTKCMRAIQKHKAKVLLGFNMAELRKVKHNLDVPEIEPEREMERSDSEDESEDDTQDEDMKTQDGESGKVLREESESKCVM